MEKILIIHNEYQQKGGEDVAVSKEIEILSKNFNVETLIFNNQIQNYISLLFSFFSITNPNSNRRLKEKLKTFNPDLVYIHNTWFKASLGIFKILQKENYKTFVKLHNFRYFCTKSFLKSNHIKKGSICNACGSSGENTLFFNKYFENSFLKSLLVNHYGKKYYKILNKEFITKIVLTNHHKKFLLELGISKNVYVNPNFIPDFSKNISVEKENVLVYAGRISDEKGVQEVISSFLDSELDSFILKIIGVGPALDRLKRKYKNKNIEFLGALDNEETLNIISKAKAVLTGTKLFEGQPTLLCEASALGIVSIFPMTGGIQEFFPTDNLFSFEQFNYKDLISKINLLKSDDKVKKQSFSNKKYLNTYLSEEKIIKNLEKAFYETK